MLPREVLSALAEQLSQLKDGARVVTLVKFPFDQFGLRRLPPDSPLQALRMRPADGTPAALLPMSWVRL